jgi:hypothetical protein
MYDGADDRRHRRRAADLGADIGMPITSRVAAAAAGMTSSACRGRQRDQHQDQEDQDEEDTARGSIQKLNPSRNTSDALPPGAGDRVPQAGMQTGGTYLSG